MPSLFRLISALMLTLLLLSPAAAIEKIKVVGDIWMPYNGEPGARHEGYAVDILRAIFERQSIEVNYRERPWKRAVEEVRSGRGDIIIGVIDRSLPDFVYPKKTLGRAVLCFYSNRPGWEFDGADSLRQMTTGLVRGYGYPEWFKAYVERNPKRVQILHGDDAFPRLVEMLAQERVQVIPGTRAVMNYYIKSKDLNGVVFLGGCYEEQEPAELYIGFSPYNPDRSRILADTFDEGLEFLRKTGYLNHPLRKYGLKDWVTIEPAP